MASASRSERRPNSGFATSGMPRPGSLLRPRRVDVGLSCAWQPVIQTPHGPNTTPLAAFISGPKNRTRAGPFPSREEGCLLGAGMAEAGMTWTEERIEVLTKLWSEGLSASQIAAELGPDVSRNAVISKAHRL